MKLLFLIIFISSLISCSGGGGLTTNNSTTPTNSNTSSLTTSQLLFNFSLAHINQNKTLTITISNNGNSATSNLSFSMSGESQITTIITGCENISLPVSGSCTMTAVLNSSTSGVFSKTVFVNSGNGILTFNLVGYVFDTNEINDIISRITDKEGVLHNGSWDFLDSDLANVAFISHALAQADSYSSVQLFTPNINFATEPSGNWLKVDKALNFLMYDTDNTILTLDKNSGTTDYNTVQTKWSDTIYSKPKQISPGLLFKNNLIYKLIYGVDLPDFTNLFNQYNDSRKIITTDISNNVTGSVSSAKAHFAYLMDDKRWPTTDSLYTGYSGYFIENAMKELDYLFSAYQSLNKTTELYELSRIMVQHWQYTLPEIQNLNDPLLSSTPDIFNPGTNLKYNPNAFDYTSYQIPGNFPVSPQVIRNSQLLFVNDYVDQGFGCRNLAYTVLNLVNAYEYGNWTTTEKTEVGNLVKDGIVELKQSWSCKYNSTSKKYTSQNNTPSGFNNNNGVPIIAKIYLRLPESIVSITEKKEMFNQIIQEVGVGGSIDLDDASGDPLIRAEVLDLLMLLI